MPEPKAQLIDPQGPIDVPGVNITGVTTATGGFVGTVQGIASSISSGSNVVAGIITATSFVGDVTGTASSVTKGANIDVGIITASSFAGDLTGNAAGLSTTTANLKLGIVTSTSFAGNLTGNSAGLSVTTSNANLGIVTATYFWGDGSNLTGIAATNWIKNNVTASGADTAIDLNNGNTVFFTQNASTTVSFANTGTSNLVTFIRKKDSSDTARTITWPSGVTWDGGVAPTLITNAASGVDTQQFMLLTRDEGVTWYGWENFNYDPIVSTAWVWGQNHHGQLGQNNETQYSSPTQIPGITWSSGTASGGAQSAIKTDGTLWGWGRNDLGLLGLNTPSNSKYSSPVQVPGTTWATLAKKDISGTGFSGAIKTDGTLWIWGVNYYGQLGLNQSHTGTYKSSPTQIPGTTWSNAAIVDNQSFAIKTDNTLWTWGRNDKGMSGVNSQTKYSSPVQIPGTTWARVSAGANNDAVATKTDGTLWAWGNGDYGALGQNNTTERSSPVQIPGTTWATDEYSIMVCNRSVYSIKTDGTLWVWGENNYGQLGDNSKTNRSSPIQIPGTTWSKVGTIADGQGVSATKTDGTLWSWGYGSYGRLAQNDTISRSSPIQVGALTSWLTPVGGYMAIQRS